MHSLSALGEENPQEQFFSGVVVEVDEERITVSRVVLGSEKSEKTFTITSETRIVGELKANTRVTVEFVTRDEADEATYIIVRKDRPLR